MKYCDNQFFALSNQGFKSPAFAGKAVCHLFAHSPNFRGQKTRKQLIHKAFSLWHLYCLRVLVGLTEPDPNQYDAIIRQKVKVIQAAKNFGQAATFIIADDAERHNREIDVFGEIAVKRLKQPYRREFSEADIKQMVSAYQSGETTTIKLAERFGCSKTTINKLLRQHGVEVTRAKAQARLNADAVVAMYDEMRTTEEIAECFHVHPQVVIRCLRANGVKIRSRWDYAKK